MGDNRKGSISHRRPNWKKTKQQDKQTGESTHDVRRSIPLSIYIDIIKQESGIDDINENNVLHHAEKNLFDCISAVEDLPPILKEMFAKSEEDVSKMQIGNSTHKEHKQAESIDLGKMEALIIDDGPAEVGKLEDKKEGS